MSAAPAGRSKLPPILFASACVLASVSTILLVTEPGGPGSRARALDLGSFTAVQSGQGSSGNTGDWNALRATADSVDFTPSHAFVKAVWGVFRNQPDQGNLNEIASSFYRKNPSVDDRAAFAFLLLESGNGPRAALLNRQGDLAAYPDLEAELAEYRGTTTKESFAYLSPYVSNLKNDLDPGVLVDFAAAAGFLGDYAESESLAQIADQATTGKTPEALGSRILLLLAAWDSRGIEPRPQQSDALHDLVKNADGILSSDPGYFSLLCDVAAFLGDRDSLNLLYEAADRANFILPVNQQRNRDLLAGRAPSNTDYYADVRAILGTDKPQDPRAVAVSLSGLARTRNDEKIYRVLAWFLWNQGDLDSLRSLLNAKGTPDSPWMALYRGAEAETRSDWEAAAKWYDQASSGEAAIPARMNLARLYYLAGQTDRAAKADDAAIQILELRSLGLNRRVGSPYVEWYADALALRARIFDSQGKSAESRSLRQEIAVLDPEHPELYRARGLEPGASDFGEQK